MSHPCERCTFGAMGRGYRLYSLYTQPSVKSRVNSPYQNWFGTKPGISNLRIFGSIAYVHIPKVERKKLDSKSISCLLVGYCTTQKAYRFWNPVARRTRISRDAIFNGQVSTATRDGMTQKEDKYTQKQLFDLIATRERSAKCWE